ncbi:ATP-dependent metallopeptidase Hfl [Basidiobolus meristosporus CBS 931.73]|uniref:ATP-dependent metallopeptidase Hfl n=1 Tax=Basidiobolus meristosporus CBS 931.73 TaxID=1314790 RepID=A0A1Y1XJU8_9FUNG|nr:ATP-dependent metallopeptidase Hfl [Basidiobolus meristosporus CBS 931.73]|eukprot:ORX85624.1 ATP-dependent metallopeptidase Hfl [Basidiobolus meristosporus CBS 931.73]
MHASFFASLPPQINLLISEASVHLNSFKIPSLTGKPSNFKFPNRASLNRVQETLHELPECIRLSRQVRSSATSGLAQATKLLQSTNSLKQLDAKQILSPTHGAFGMPLLTTKPLRLLPDPQQSARSLSPVYSLWRAAFRVPNVAPRRHYSPFRFVNQRRLAKLESEANSAPENAKKQAIYYKELISADFPDIIIRRFESNKFAYDNDCLTLYSKALARTDQVDKIVPSLLQKIKKNGEVATLASGEGVPKATVESIVQSVVGGPGKTVRIENPGSLSSGVGIKENPIHVVVDEARGFMFWRALRWVGVTFTYAFCILTFLSLALENSGLLKAANNQTEYEPSTQSVVKFSDVQGVEEAKQELQEIVEFLKNPSKFSELGGRLPKGVLLTGPPGTGKTLLARAVAGEAGVPFFFMSGSEFDEMYVGVGARRIRELFAAARRKAPSIVFIDEIDAIGSKRNPKDQTYMKQTLNQLLVDLDGFSQTEGVIFIAATNFPELLDKALVRPGRFDRNVNVPLPDVRGRIAILEHHMHNVQADKEVDISIIARGTPGFSGADLANLVNQAAIQASREGGKVVNLKHFEHAKDKIIMGAERRSAVITEESKLLTAYHEGGHALVAYYTPGAMPLHKATIMPRGQSLGMTVQLPEMDKDSYSRKEYQAMLDVCMGGRVAEELIFGSENVTSGAHNDIMKATDVAKRMVTQFGMSEKVGPVSISEDEMSQLSTQTKMVVEGEIRTFVEMAQTRANNILKTHKEELHRLAKALIEYETLDQAEIEAAIKGKPIVR